MIASRMLSKSSTYTPAASTGRVSIQPMNAASIAFVSSDGGTVDGGRVVVGSGISIGVTFKLLSTAYASAWRSAVEPGPKPTRASMVRLPSVNLNEEVGHPGVSAPLGKHVSLLAGAVAKSSG